jgi:hypothetical protein
MQRAQYVFFIQWRAIVRSKGAASKRGTRRADVTRIPTLRRRTQLRFSLYLITRPGSQLLLNADRRAASGVPRQIRTLHGESSPQARTRRIVTRLFLVPRERCELDKGPRYDDETWKRWQSEPALLGLRRMARVFAAPHPNNELRNAQHVGIRGRSSSSLFLSLYIYISRSLFTGGERAGAFKPILHGITRQARACCIKQKGEEESSLRIAPTWFRRGLPRGRLAGKQNASGLSSTPASTRTRFTYRYSARCQ